MDEQIELFDQKEYKKGVEKFVESLDKRLATLDSGKHIHLSISEAKSLVIFLRNSLKYI